MTITQLTNHQKNNIRVEAEQKKREKYKGEKEITMVNRAIKNSITPFPE